MSTREPRPLRNIPLGGITALAESERLSVDELTRLLLSFATFKWESRWQPVSSSDGSKTVRLSLGGVEAVQRLADVEQVAWGEMVRRLLEFGVDRWEPGWRKESPGRLGRSGVDKHALASTLAV